MTQANPIIGSGNSGIEYRNKDNDGKQALLSHNKGPSAPGYAEAGTIWLDDAATPWQLKIHDGSEWIVLATVNAGTNMAEAWHGAAPLRILNYAADTGASNNTFAVAPSPPASAYTTGMVVTLKPGHAQTGAATLNVNALGTKSIKTADGNDPQSGAMTTGGMYILVYDGTNFVLTNPAVTSIGNAVSVTLKDTGFILQDDGNTTRQAKFELSAVTAGQTRTLTVPDANGTLVLTSGAQTLSGKTLDDSNAATFKGGSFQLEDDTTTSKKAQFDISAVSASTTRTLAVPNKSGTLALTSDVIGVGQTWQDMTSSRAKATDYVNNTGKPIFVSVMVMAGGATAQLSLLVDGVTAAYFGSGAWASSSKPNLTTIVPAGSTYRLTDTGTSVINNWSELR